MNNQMGNKKNAKIKSSYNITVKVVAGACIVLIVGSLFLSLLY